MKQPTTTPTTPAWAEISLGALQHNFRELQRLAKGSQILPVVKANAYGHGLVPVSKALLEAGAKFLAVAFVQEGLALRKAGVACPILVLTPTLPAEIQALIQNHLTPQVSSFTGAQALSKIARKMDIRSLDVHVKIDTGMGRVGVQTRRALGEIEKISRVPGLKVRAIYTHLATADWSDPKYAWKQIALFQRTLDQVRAKSGRGLGPASHVANSAALLNDIPQARGTWARPGIALYGVYPSPAMKKRAKLIPVMQVKTRVLYIKNLEKGESVSYGRTFTAKKKMRVATLGIGYADGVLRSLSNKGTFLIRGVKVPVLGRVCMDMTMVDVSKVRGAREGDQAVFFGRDGKEFLSVEDQAARAGTISYELLCAVGERVSRIYKD